MSISIRLRKHGFFNLFMFPFFVLFSLFLSGCGSGGNDGPPGLNGVEHQQAVTPATGQIQFHAQANNTQVQVKVQDVSGRPLEGIAVKMVSDRDQIVVLATDPSGHFLPAIRSVESGEVRAHSLGGVELILIALTVKAVYDLVHEYRVDPQGSTSSMSATVACESASRATTTTS